MIDGLLDGLDNLLGHGNTQGNSAGAQARELSQGPGLPANWHSQNTQALDNRHKTTGGRLNTWAANDDHDKNTVDAAAAAVRDGKTRMATVKQDYKTSRARLASANHPAAAAALASLDSQRAADGADTVRSTISRLPSMGGATAAAPAAMMGQMMPALTAPLGAVTSAVSAPLQMLQTVPSMITPATGMLTSVAAPAMASSGGSHGVPGRVNGHVREAAATGGGLPPGVGSEQGLQRDTILAKRAVSAAFPEISDIGGWRPDSLHWHPDGQAIDVMIPDPLSENGKALGDQVLQFALAHSQQFDVNHIIWQDRIYNPDGSSSDFGANWNDVTQAHRNHVHIATNGGGYPSGSEVYRI